MSDLPTAFVFESLDYQNNNGRAYRVYSDWGFDRKKTHDPVATWATAFDTYKDRLVQHSGEWVVQRESFTDFCASLAHYLITLADGLGHTDHVDVLVRHWPHPLGDDAILFAAKLKYDEEKQYPALRYNLAERKSSRAESKRHDNRWEDVPHWADGSFEAVVKLLHVSHTDLWSAMVRWCDIRDAYRRLTGSWLSSDDKAFQEWFKLDGPDPYDCFSAIRSLVQAAQARREAARWLRNWEGARDRLAQKKAEAEAAIINHQAGEVAAS